ADGMALAPQRLNHAFCLLGGHDGALLPLEEDHRLRKPIRVIERRALAIARFLLRIRSDQPVEIARLELMGVAREGSDVAHAVMTSPALKEVAEGQRRQRRVAAGAAAADDASLAVDPPLRCEEPRAGDAIVDVDHEVTTGRDLSDRRALSLFDTGGKDSAMIQVRLTAERDPFIFDVVVSEGKAETRHHVTMSREMCERLTAGKHTPERCL